MTIGGCIAFAGFVLTPVFYFLEFPPNGREVGLMVVAGCYGLLLGALIASSIWYLSKSKGGTSRSSRPERVRELENEIAEAKQAIAHEVGEKASSLVSAREARLAGWDDFFAQYTAAANQSEIRLEALRIRLEQVTAELARVQDMSSRQWAKEAKRS